MGGGQLKYAVDYTYFLAPYINSYKRFQAGTFAPTKIMWSQDNRTAGFRLCGEGTKGIRIECRIGGADLNPYLAFAALIAAGLKGIDENLELEEPFVGDAYSAVKLKEIPYTLRDAAEALKTQISSRKRSVRAWSITMSIQLIGSRLNMTAALPIGNCIAALNDIDLQSRNRLKYRMTSYKGTAR